MKERLLLLLAPLCTALACNVSDAGSGPVASPVASAASSAAVADDPRTAYDVLAYRLDLVLDPGERRLDGTVTVELAALADGLATVRLDLVDELAVGRVERIDAQDGAAAVLDGPDVPRGAPLAFRHADDALDCTLDAPARAGERVLVAVTYGGSPRALDGFSGFHWAESDGKPWITTSCQHPGAHSWWPCKASRFHPEDKPERVRVAIDVPEGLTAVSNGRLVEQTTAAGRSRFRWAHDYPLETYSVTLDVAPYVAVETELELPGLDRPLPFAYWVLPTSVLKARLQFRDVPDMLRVFSEAFGPFPFPDSKFGLVETSFWGMEHSTAIAYGSSYPAWCAETGERDRYADRNRFFDYILVHESAHEWWGNAVSAASWGDFWIHEGFATYAEGVYLERLEGREKTDEWLASIRRQVGPRSRLWRGDVDDARDAYGFDIYYKGAWVLETLRQYVRDDDAWWASLRDFNLRYRYGNATTEDFLAVLAERTGRDWTRFADEWIRGEGWPRLEGSVRATDAGFSIDVKNEGSGSTGFHVPIDLVFTVGGEPAHERVWLEPGANTVFIDFELTGPIADLRLEGLGRILGEHDVVTVSR